MASTIQLKTGTGSAVPSSLTQGEVAINVDNGLIYYGSGSVNSVKQLETFTNITASVVSASGHIFADRIAIDDGDSSFAGQVTVEGNILANGQIIGDDQTGITGIKLIISDQFVSSSQLISNGNITASLNISASGDVTCNRFVGNVTNTSGYRYANLLNIPSGIISSSLQNLGNITGSNISASGNIIGGAITSNGNAVISQSGAFTNNEFIVAVGDSAVTSSDALAVDSNGNLGIGTPNPEVRLHMLGEAAQTTQILMEQFNDTADAPDIRTRRYRGTSASRADVQTGDYLFRLNVHGQDDGSSELYGSMRFDVDSSDQDALEWGLQTRDTEGNVADRIKINSSGDSEFTSNITASGNISASGQIFSNNYYQWEATARCDTDDDSNWQGPNSKGLMSNEDWNFDYGTDYDDNSSTNAESRLYMNTGWWVPHGANYSASIKSMDIYVQPNSNITHADDDFFSCSLWYSHNSDLQSELNHVDSNSGTFVQRHGASVDSLQCKASDEAFFKYNNYHVSQSINLDLAPGSMLFPRIKTGGTNNFNTNVYWVIHYCKKPL